MKAKRGIGARVLFRCPGCDEVHVIREDLWTFNGDLEAPTFSPSVLVQGGPENAVCHSFVTAGRIAFLGDSTHALAGQAVDLPDWSDDGPGTAG